MALLFQMPAFYETLKPSDISMSWFEICYSGVENVICVHPCTARWLSLYQTFIHFCRKNNTTIHFLAVVMIHEYLTAINIWISRVIVTLTMTQKRRHRHLCYFMLLSFITGEKNKTINSFLLLFFSTVVYTPVSEKNVVGLNQVIFESDHWAVQYYKRDFIILAFTIYFVLAQRYQQNLKYLYVYAYISS